MKNILVPVDFSDGASNALSYAIELFKNQDLKITLLHIFGMQSTALMMKNIDGVLIKDAERQMESFLKKHKEKHPDVKFETKIRKNYPVDTIVQMSENNDFDYIVMGTKGATGLKEVFLGSIAGGVVANSQTPTIVVPDGYEFKGIDSIVLAVNDDPIKELDSVKPLRDLAITNNSSLTILHITEGDIPHLVQLKSLLSDVNHNTDYSYSSGNVNNDINSYLEKKESHLICLIRGRKSILDRLFDKSVTMKQTFNSPVPLLILHDQ
ncbi:MAG: universal stress protein [Bacteroidota bacterium]